LIIPPPSTTYSLSLHDALPIYIWPRIFHFPQTFENIRHQTEKLPNYLDHRIILQMFFCEKLLSGKSRIRFSEYSMSITGNDTTLIKRFLYEVRDLFIRRILRSDFLQHFKDEFDHFLIGQAMQRTGQSIHTGRQRIIGITQSRPYQM